MTHSVDVDCAVGTDPTVFVRNQGAARKEHPTWQTQALGRSAYGDATEVHAFDDDANCTVTVLAPGGDAVSLTRAVLQTLSPAVVAAGEPTLSCRRLLPAPLVERLLPGRTLRWTSDLPGTLACSFERPAPPGQVPDVVRITYFCGPSMGPFDPNAFAGSFPMERISWGGGGLVAVRGDGIGILFRDGEAPCSVGVDSPSGDPETALALAQAVERALTPEAFGP